MRAVVQRVSYSAVKVDDEIVGEIKQGLNVLIGIGEGDNESDLKYIAEKVVNLRIFEDSDGKMNLSCLDIRGEILLISQFTLLGDCRKGRRPSFSHALEQGLARELFLKLVEEVKNYPVKKVATGVFQAKMDVIIHNDGPVTLLLDSKKAF